MAETMAMTIHVSAETRELIRERSGDEPYISDSQILQEAFEPMEEDAELKEWECAEIIAARDELDADPSSEVTLEELRAHLAVARKQRYRAL